MSALRDASIQAAIKRVETTKKPIALADGEGKGGGRLRLTIRPKRSGVLAEWYAVQWRDGKRAQRKLGTYPTMTLSKARAAFTAGYEPTIRSGTDIRQIEEETPLGTVHDLFDGYVSHLKQREASSWEDVKYVLDKAETELGLDKLAKFVTPDDIIAYLRPIYRRGSKHMANKARAHIHAAFAWGITSERDYRQEVCERRFGMLANPATGIPTEPPAKGTRWLDATEFAEVYRWLGDRSFGGNPVYMSALQLLMILGQRPGEIAVLAPGHLDKPNRTLFWEKTKNGEPHLIPVPPIAMEIIEQRDRDNSGFMFPAAHDHARTVSVSTLLAALKTREGFDAFKHFTIRDLRRTWKTLTGYAGLTREERDLLQNHTRQDVASKHYDRYEYLAEKRAAMEKWGAWVEALLAGKVEQEEVAVAAE